MTSKATAVADYLEELPADRRSEVEAVRSVVNEHLNPGFEEGMQYGMIGWFVPHSVYPPGYHCDPKQPLPFVSLASQKNHLSLYLMCLFGDTDRMGWFREAWAATGKKLDMGKSCIRFKKAEALALDVIGDAIAGVTVEKLVASYEEARTKGGRTC
jgi:hypothetical protein